MERRWTYDPNTVGLCPDPLIRELKAIEDTDQTLAGLSKLAGAMFTLLTGKPGSKRVARALEKVRAGLCANTTNKHFGGSVDVEHVQRVDPWAEGPYADSREPCHLVLVSRSVLKIWRGCPKPWRGFPSTLRMTIERFYPEEEEATPEIRVTIYEN